MEENYLFDEFDVWNMGIISYDDFQIHRRRISELI